jgi:type II secretory pathway predicted ATPase ExeA
MILGEIKMQIEVMEHFGIKKYFRDADFFETEVVKRLFKQLKKIIPEGQLIALTGVVGIGKTTYLERMQKQLSQEKKVIVAKSLSVEKTKTNLTTLITALFYDVSGDKDYRVPKLGEKRERDLRNLIKDSKKPVVLFVDEAHDLHHRTLTGLKRLMEVIRDGGGRLSIVLAGHPKLRNDLKSPTMEEVGFRTITMSLDASQGTLRDYVKWLLNDCTDDKVKITDIIEDQAIDYLTEQLTTPLQVEQHLTAALEEAFITGTQIITVELLTETMSKRIDEIEPRLIRHGYNEKVIADQFRYRTAEIRKLFKGELDANRSREMTTEMREAGLPI